MDDDRKKIGLYIIIVTLLLQACFMSMTPRKRQRDKCSETNTKCNDHRIMVCVDGDWEELQDCTTLNYIDGGTSDGVCCDTPQKAECREECYE